MRASAVDTRGSGLAAAAVRRLLAESAGLSRKRAIGSVAEILAEGHRAEGWPESMGDDAAALPDGDGFLLLAADGIWHTLMRDPFWAGYCSVLVNVNDISAMGGRPLAMVNVMIGADEERRRRIAEGIAFGSRHFRVPMVGGHLHPEGTEEGVAVAVLGRADRLIDSFGSRPGDQVLVAVDLDGGWHEPFGHWDTTTRRTPEEIQAQLAVMPELARRGLARAGKDISNPGFLGTLLMLMETSGVGARVRPEDLPRPSGVDPERWLRSYPGLGYVLAVPDEHVTEVSRLFESAGIAAAVIGEFVGGTELSCAQAGGAVLLWDWEIEPVTGIRPASKETPAQARRDDGEV